MDISASSCRFYFKLVRNAFLVGSIPGVGYAMAREKIIVQDNNCIFLKTSTL
jgi:hypothetical protein